MGINSEALNFNHTNEGSDIMRNLNLKGYAVFTLCAAENCNFNFVGRAEKEETIQVAVEFLSELSEKDICSLRAFCSDFNFGLDELRITVEEQQAFTVGHAKENYFCKHGIKQGKAHVLRDEVLFKVIRTFEELSY